MLKTRIAAAALILLFAQTDGAQSAQSAQSVQPEQAAKQAAQKASLVNVKKGWWTAKAAYPVFIGDSVVRQKARAAFKAGAAALHSAFVRETKTALKAAGRPVRKYVFELKTVVGVDKPRIVSGYFETYEYRGGAHPTKTFLPLSFGLMNGIAVPLTLKSLLRSDTSAAGFIKTALLPEINAQKKAKGAEPLKTLDAELADAFVITSSGLSWLFAPDVIGAYAEGDYGVKLPFEALQRWLNPKGPLRPLLAGKIGPVRLTGTLNYPENSRLPPRATVEFRLLRLLPNAPPVTLLRYSLPAEAMPMPFALTFDPMKFPYNSAYYLEADIKSDGIARFHTEDRISLPAFLWRTPLNIVLKKR